MKMENTVEINMCNQLLWITIEFSVDPRPHMRCPIYRILELLIGFCLLPGSYNFQSAIKLYQTLLDDSNYNKLIRPVDRNGDAVTTYIGLKLTQLIDLNMRDQKLTTNVWVVQEWNDVNLRWNPDDYEGVKQLHIPSSRIWLPDIVLYNNADGKYEVRLMTKAKVFYDGTVKWSPPAIYKSSCHIDVEFFPYDIQICHMTFASWTYNEHKMVLKHYTEKGIKGSNNRSETVLIKHAVDLRDFYTSVEFDILELSAVRHIRQFHTYSETFPEVTFSIIMRRKTLFYTVNLMVPCLAMSFLSVLVFYLPTQSGEKISLSINILLSLILFFLFLVETIPSTSLVVPLLGKYLLFTFILISFSIIVTVIVLNFNFRSAMTHSMSPWMKKFFLEIMPPILFLHGLKNNEKKNPESNFTFYNPTFSETTSNRFINENLKRRRSTKDYKLKDSDFDENVDRTVKGLEYIVNNLKDEDTSSDVQEQWKFVAVVVDRLFLFMFLSAYLISTVAIIFRSPALYDRRVPLNSIHQPNQTTVTYLSKIGNYSITVTLN